VSPLLSARYDCEWPRVVALLAVLGLTGLFVFGRRFLEGLPVSGDGYSSLPAFLSLLLSVREYSAQQFKAALLTVLSAATVCGAWALYDTTTRGKRLEVDHLIAQMRRWTGREHVLDVACGTGTCLIAAAKQLTLPGGRAVGLDLWNTSKMPAAPSHAAGAAAAAAAAAGAGAGAELDRKGDGAGAPLVGALPVSSGRAGAGGVGSDVGPYRTMMNAWAEGVAGRVELRVMDARALSALPAASFDVVTCTYAMHQFTSNEQTAIVGQMLRVPYRALAKWTQTPHRVDSRPAHCLPVCACACDVCVAQLLKPNGTLGLLDIWHSRLLLALAANGVEHGALLTWRPVAQTLLGWGADAGAVVFYNFVPELQQQPHPSPSPRQAAIEPVPAPIDSASAVDPAAAAAGPAAESASPPSPSKKANIGRSPRMRPVGAPPARAVAWTP
jgi:SAM-dependent methyltransferase